MRRAALAAIAIAAILILLATSTAHAASDLYSNVGPGGSVSGLADRYPIGNYALDQHFSAIKASITGGVDASGIPSMIAFFLANLLWQIAAFVANALILLFGFAFSLDLVNGSSATGGAGALAPVGDAIAGLYANTFGEPWATFAITLAGCWAMWRALVQRRYTETASALTTSLIFCLIALAIVSKPEATIGSATRWTNQISTAFLSVTSTGQVASGTKARSAAADALFTTLVYKPWVALNFGGTEHCTRPGTGSKDHDPDSVPVRPLPRAASHTLQTSETVSAAGKACVNNTRRYAQHFLQFSPGSDPRDAEYSAINEADPGKLPDEDPAKKAGTYKPTILDKPATDAMEKGGQYQRLLLALVILFGELGAFLLLGALALSVVMAQVIVLLLACFAPVALVAGIIPGRGHDLFRTWAQHLATYLVRKAAYSLVLAVVLAVMSALEDATSNLGWLMSFGLQAALLWIIFLQRHKLTGQLTAAISGQTPGRDTQLRKLLGVAYATRTITPARRPTPMPVRRVDEHEHERHRSSAPAEEARADELEVGLTGSARPRTRDPHPAHNRRDEPIRSHPPRQDASPTRAGGRPAHRRARDERDTPDPLPTVETPAATGSSNGRAACRPTERAPDTATPVRPAERRSRPASSRPAPPQTPEHNQPEPDPGAPSPTQARKDPAPPPPPVELDVHRREPAPPDSAPERSLADELAAEREHLRPPTRREQPEASEPPPAHRPNANLDLEEEA